MQTTVQDEASGKSMLIVGDPGVRNKNLASFLHHAVQFTNYGKTAKAAQIVQAVLRIQPSILLVDIPNASRIWLHLIKRVKAANRQIKVLAVCRDKNAGVANRVLRAGADGYVLSHTSANEINSAVYDVLAGGIYVSEEVLNLRSEPRQLHRTGDRQARFKSPSPPTSLRNHVRWKSHLEP